MLSVSVASRYAEALYQTAARDALVDTVRGDLRWLDRVVRPTPLLEVLQRPTLTRSQKVLLLQRVLGPYLHQASLHFLLFLLHKKRLGHLLAIIEAFQEAYVVHQEIQKVYLTTAHPASAALQARITAWLQQRIPQRTVQLITYVDPSLLGGFVLNIGTRQVDTSLRRQLVRLQHAWTLPLTATKPPIP